jgi:hypothetical protein
MRRKHAVDEPKDGCLLAAIVLCWCAGVAGALIWSVCA